MKLAIIVSHAIQYQTPLFQKLAQDPQCDIKVYFCWQFGLKKTFDRQFDTSVEWDIPLLDGFPFKLLRNYSPRPSNAFFGQMNFGIISELWRNNFDALLIHGWYSLTNILGYCVARCLRIPVIVHGESCFFQEQQQSSLKQRMKKYFLGKFFRGISAFLTIGENNRKFYEFYGVPAEKMYWCPYTVDTDRFIGEAEQLLKQKESLKLDLGIPADAVVIMMAGKLIEKKRPFDLLQAFRGIRNDRVRLAFVGDGHLRTHMEEYIKTNKIDNVLLLGFVNQSQLPRYYAAADILVLASGIGETWGLVVNEAMCFSLPIVVSDHVGCAPDMVKHGVNGFVFPLGDIDALTSYLKRLVNNGDERKEFGKQSFVLIQEYTHQKDIQGILHAMHDVCTSPVQTLDFRL